MLQDGLDFNEFLKAGWFNDNHGKAMVDVVGYPEGVKFFKKGEALPNGVRAPANGHWAEGYLLENVLKAETIWQLGSALQKSGDRRLGFSIEGKIERRSGPDYKTIAKAKVRNVAVTHCPVNTDTQLDILAKSLVAAGNSPDEFVESVLGPDTAAAAKETMIDGISDDDLRDRPFDPAHDVYHMKALTAGPGSPNKPIGPRQGDGAGRVLSPQSLDSKARDELLRIEKASGKSLAEFTSSEAVAFVLSRYPKISCATAGRIVDVTLALRRRGLGGRNG